MGPGLRQIKGVFASIARLRPGWHPLADRKEFGVKTSDRLEARLRKAFAAALLLMLGLCAGIVALDASAEEAAAHALAAQELLGDLARIRADTLQVELSTQGFRISGDANFLAERDSAMAKREESMARAHELVRLDPIQLRRWQQLRALIDQRVAIAREVERLRKTFGQDEASAYVARMPLRQTREQMIALLSEMRAEEQLALAQRSARQLRLHEDLRWAGAAALLGLLFLLVAAYRLSQGHLRDMLQTRRALADSEQRLATTLDSIADGVIASDEAGRITRMNAMAENMTGWSLQEARGRPWSEVFRVRLEAEDPLPEFGRLDTGALASGSMLLLHRNGASCPIAQSSAPIRTADGEQSLGWVQVFHDVSAERTASRNLRNQNEQLEQRVQERTAQLCDRESHLLSVLAGVPALIAYVDKTQHYAYVNEQYRLRFAPDRDQLTGWSEREVLGLERYALAAPHIAAVLRGEPRTYDWEPFPGVWMQMRYLPQRDATQRVAGYYVLGTDISERKRSESRIRDLNQELAQRVGELERVGRALRTLSAGNRAMLRAQDEGELLHSMCQAIVEAGGCAEAVVWFADAGQDPAVRRVAAHRWPGTQEPEGEAGRAALLAAHYAAQALQEGRQFNLPTSDDPHALALLVCPLRVSGGLLGALSIQARADAPLSGQEIEVLAESADDLAFGIANLRTRVQQQATQAEMQHMSRFDRLTGLPNETRFTEFLVEAIAEHGQSQRFGLLQANVEHLREINDTLGFDHGDALLREFAQRLQQAVPDAARLARLRGDEFAVLLPKADTSELQALRVRLEKALAAPVELAEVPIDLSMRCGMACYPDHGATPHDLFRHMDLAVQQARARGRRHALFDASQERGTPQRLILAAELRRAIERKELCLFLQPKLALSDGAVCGAEALVRWQHPERGLVPPAEFIALAEHTGLIKPLTEWVIDAALACLHHWQTRGLMLPVAVNLSARNLHDSELTAHVRERLTIWGTAPGLLEFEITETTVMEDAEFALGVLQGLRKLGIPLHIDDFGTGYSSLSYLQRLPVQVIKIDRSFVAAMAHSPDAALIVRSTIDLAHDLGRKVVAEGLESERDWTHLAALGCDQAQGFWIARPLPAAEFPAWVQQHDASRLQLMTA